MNAFQCACSLCSWKAAAASVDEAGLVVDMHLRDVHGLGPESGIETDYLALADSILDGWISEDDARDAETALQWMNLISVQDAAFLISLKILPN